MPLTSEVVNLQSACMCHQYCLLWHSNMCRGIAPLNPSSVVNFPTVVCTGLSAIDDVMTNISVTRVDPIGHIILIPH